MTQLATKTMVDGSMLITEALVRAGADVFIGYPITPANLLYKYGGERFPLAMAAPDEITTLQWMAGFATAGKIPATATSFPGYALMIESINMAYMMELPMVIVLAQRLGPSTGTATVSAQGDILTLAGTISGGYSLPTLSTSSLQDCWTLAAESVRWAAEMRSPVVLLTTKEETMTTKSFDIDELHEISPVSLRTYRSDSPFKSYQPAENLVPEFLPVGNKKHRVRITSSTHNQDGILQNSTPEALANSSRLQEKLEHNLGDFTFFEHREEEAETLIVSYGVTAQAVHSARAALSDRGCPVSTLILKTLFPVPAVYYDIIGRYRNVIVVEENLRGQYCQVLFGARTPENVRKVNGIGRIITPEEIIEVVEDVQNLS